jgi:hypothetical protein
MPPTASHVRQTCQAHAEAWQSWAATRAATDNHLVAAITVIVGIVFAGIVLTLLACIDWLIRRASGSIDKPLHLDAIGFMLLTGAVVIWYLNALIRRST